MKKYILIMSLFLSIFIIIGATAVVTTYYKDYPVVRVFVDGVELVSKDVPAFQIDGRTMVPLRMVGEALNAEVEWDASTQSVRIIKEKEEVMEEPEEKLIELSDLEYNYWIGDTTEVTGNITNNNSSWVDIRLTINYYSDRDYLGHIHINIDDIAAGDTKDFIVEGKGDLARYIRKEIIFDQLVWND
jgi:hypothetical protein